MFEEPKFSMLERYGENFTEKEYITNPAIGRDKQIKELLLILLTPEKSAILTGKPGIGKTAIVEGLAFAIQEGRVPDALKGYTVINIKTASLLGTMPNGESKVQVMIDELKEKEKIILFIDEIHMLIGSTDESSLDFANIFKEGLGRGSIKVVGATTTEEYERYILRDKAFARRFQKVEVPEPTREETINIMLGTLPKIEKTTGAKMKYTDWIKEQILLIRANKSLGLDSSNKKNELSEIVKKYRYILDEKTLQECDEILQPDNKQEKQDESNQNEANQNEIIQQCFEELLVECEKEDPIQDRHLQHLSKFFEKYQNKLTDKQKERYLSLKERFKDQTQQQEPGNNE